MIFNSEKTRARRACTGLLSLAVAASLGACGILDVENPNNLVQADIENPAAAAALANGAFASVARGLAEYAAPIATASDELTWIGSRDAWSELNRGILNNPSNEFSDDAFEFMAEGRWTSDEAIKILSASKSEGTLSDNTILAKAYLAGALVYTAIADWMDNFAFSDRQESAMPVGPGNMDSVYRTAIEYLDQALINAAGDSDLEVQILATRARAKQALAIWGLLNPEGTTPANPLINDAGARSDALDVLARVGNTTDWRFEASYGPTTVDHDMGFQVNSRLELRFADRYAVADSDGQRRASTALLDPITLAVDPAVDGVMDRFEEGGANGSEWPQYVLATAREMHLIVAEAELAAGNQAGFELHVNHVRDMDDLPDFTGQIDNTTILVHSRQANLYLMGRRLNDMYRFGVLSDNWQPGTVAILVPGTLLPISQGERESNEFCVADPSIC